MTDNDKIITDIGEDEQQQSEAQPQDAQAPQQPKQPSESLSYKDAPEDIKRQIEAQAGLTPSTMTSPGQQQLDQSAQQQGHSQNMDIVNAVQPPGQVQAPGESQTTEPNQAPSEEEVDANVQAVMKQFDVDENTALAALAAEQAGFPPEDVINHLAKITGDQNVQA